MDEGGSGGSSSPREWQRFYLGYRERFVDDCVITLPGGQEVRLRQAPSAKQFKHTNSSIGQQRKASKRQQQQQQQQQQQGLDKQSDPALTGSTVWDGAVVLSQYLCSECSPLHSLRAHLEQQQQQSTTTCSNDNNPAAAAASDTAGVSGVVPAAAPALAPQTAQHPPAPAQQPVVHPGPRQPSAAVHTEGLPQPSSTQPSQLPQPPQPSQPPAYGLTCLELGAGTGAVALSLLAAGAVDHALLTDIPDMLPHLLSNVEHNSGMLDASRALVLPLRWAETADVAALPRLGQEEQQRQRLQQLQRGCRVWGQAAGGVSAAQPGRVRLEPPFDLIVGSDLIYYSYTPSTPHSRLLLQALVQLAGPSSTIFLALSLHHNPQEVAAFLRWAERDWGFAVERVTQGIPPDYVVPDVLVVKLVLRDAGKAAQAAAAAAAGSLQRND